MQRLKRFDGCSVRIEVSAFLQSVENPEEGPHSLVEMGVQMAMENSIADHFVKAPRAIQNIQRHALLRTDGHGIDNGGTGILQFSAPLVVVQMEHMGLLNTAVDQANLGRIANVGLQDRRCRIPIGPGAHGDILVDIRMVTVWLQRRPVAHRLGAVADGSSSAGKSRVRIDRRLPICRIDFQFVVEKDGILPERGLSWVVDIRKQATLDLVPGHRIEPP